MCTYLLAAGESYVRAMVRRASHLTADKISSVFLTLKRTLLVAFVFFGLFVLFISHTLGHFSFVFFLERRVQGPVWIVLLAWKFNNFGSKRVYLNFC